MISPKGSATAAAPSSRQARRFTLNIGVENIADSNSTTDNLLNSEGCRLMPIGLR